MTDMNMKNRITEKFLKYLDGKDDDGSVLDAVARLSNEYSIRSDSNNLTEQDKEDVQDFANTLRENYLSEAAAKAIAFDRPPRDNFILTLADDLEMEKIEKSLGEKGGREADELSEIIMSLHADRIIHVECTSCYELKIDIPKTIKDDYDKKLYAASVREVCRLLLYYGGTMIIACRSKGLQDKLVTEIYGVWAEDQQWGTIEPDEVKWRIEHNPENGGFLGKLDSTLYKTLPDPDSTAEIISLSDRFSKR